MIFKRKSQQENGIRHVVKQTQTANTHSKLIQYKHLMTVCATPEKLHEYNPTITDLGYRWREDIGTFYQCIWK